MNNTGKKYGGRTQGTPNRLTTEVRKKISDALNNSIENLESDLATLNTKERLEVVAKLLNFILPKLKEIDINTDEKEPISEIRVNIINGNSD